MAPEADFHLGIFYWDKMKEVEKSTLYWTFSNSE